MHAGNRSGELQSPRVVPVHLAHLARRVGYRERIPVGIVNVMIMPDLRGCRRVVVVLVQISERIRLCHLTRIHLLFLGERLVHNAIGHIQSIRRRFGLFVFRNQMIDVVVGIAVAVCSAELLLVLLSQALRDCIVGDTEDIVHQLQVRLGLVLHDGITQRNELYLLQTFVLLVVSVIAFRPIAELGRNGMFIA